MKRSDFLKRIGLAIGAIAALPAVALKAIKSTNKVIITVVSPTHESAKLWFNKFGAFYEGIQWTPAQTKILEGRATSFSSPDKIPELPEQP